MSLSYQDKLVEVVEVGVLDDGDDDGDDQPEGEVADVEEQRHLPEILNLKSTLGYLVSQVPGHGDSPDVVEVIKIPTITADENGQVKVLKILL